MFNMLNNRTDLGKNSPLVCKILVLVAPFFLDFFPAQQGAIYLLERIGLRKDAFLAIGLRIALSIRPAQMQLGTGKG
jgi:hypothetical protein